MRKEYDFSDSVSNPYAKHLKKQVTLRLNTDAIAYFKALARGTGIPYQNLINLYLTECAHSGKKLALRGHPERMANIINAWQSCGRHPPSAKPLM